jgi:hypothetical protein
MNRRGLLRVLAGTAISSGILFTAGCSENTASFDPVSETIQLGTSTPVSLDTDLHVTTSTISSTHDSEEFESEVTKRASVLVHDYVTWQLRDQGLRESGISPERTRLRTDKIDTNAHTDEFKRAIPLAVVVNHRYHYANDGELTHHPTVDFDTLLSQLPRSVTVAVSESVHFGEYEVVLPVAGHRYWTQNT